MYVDHRWYRLLLFKFAIFFLKYQWSSSQDADTSGCFQCCYKGEIGVSGPPGHPGPTGPMGYSGYPGIDGQGGQPGERGDPGEKGETGDSGSQGYVGDIGLQGHGSGIKGDTGGKGAKGSVGPKGAQGKQGSQGAKGIKGSRGDQGDRGIPALSTRSFFSVQLTRGLFKTQAQQVTILYNSIHTNEGVHINPSSGVYTAPVNGIYYFAATVYRQAGIQEFGVYVKKNLEVVTFMSGGSVNSTDSTSVSVILPLNMAETVYLAVKENSELNLSAGQGVMFAGYLISENS